jgi:hypothetical protein
MKRALLLTTLITLISTGALAAKKIYKWTDAKGVVHYSETQPGNQAGQGNQTLNAQGLVVATQANQATAVQIAEQKKADEAKARADKAQKDADQRLLDSYASEADIERGYQQNIQLLDQQIGSTTADIGNREKGLAKLVAQAAETERTGKPVAEQIKQLIVNERNQIAVQKKYVADRQAQKLTAKTKFDSELARYREVSARMKK